MNSELDTPSISAAKEIFRSHKGILRTQDALKHGIHQRTLYTMRDTGILERIERGLYRLSELPPLSNPDLTTVGRKIPRGVICLISALHFHNITTQIPHRVSVAVCRGTEAPRLSFPPIHTHWFSGEAFTAGVGEHTIDDTKVRVFNPEKTLADCFKYRNKIGLDTALEALDLYLEQGKPNRRALLKMARVCRVENIMRPYLEARL